MAKKPKLTSLAPGRPLDPGEQATASYQSLVAQYRGARERLKAELSNPDATDFQKHRAKQLLQQIDEEIRTLDFNASAAANQSISMAYKQGTLVTEKVAKFSAELPEQGVNFDSLIHKRAVATLTQQMAEDFLNANDETKKDLKRLIRRTQQVLVKENDISSILAQGIIAGETRKAVSDRLYQKFADKVETGQLMTVGKRNYDPEKYAVLVARTRTREAASRGTLNAAVEFDMDLMQIDVHGDACPICRTRMGRVYSISGNDPNFPKLESLPPFHPHCECNAFPTTAEVLKYRGQYDAVSALSKQSPQTDDPKEAQTWLNSNPSGDIKNLPDYHKRISEGGGPNQATTALPQKEEPPKPKSQPTLKPEKPPKKVKPPKTVVAVPKPAPTKEIKLEKPVKPPQAIPAAKSSTPTPSPAASSQGAGSAILPPLAPSDEMLFGPVKSKRPVVFDKFLAELEQGKHGFVDVDVEKDIAKKAAKAAKALEKEWDDQLRSGSAASAAKAKIARELHEKTGFTPEQTSLMIRNWADSSNDSNFVSLRMQERAAEVFKLKTSAWQKQKIERFMDSNEATTLTHPFGQRTSTPNFDTRKYDHKWVWNAAVPDSTKAKYKTLDKAEEGFLGAMYENTQEYFKSKNITHVRVYRGIQLTSDEAKNLDFEHAWSRGKKKVNLKNSNAMESWSFSKKVATQFAGSTKSRYTHSIVMEAVIPVERIVGSAQSGYGCLSEFEVVVLGTPPGTRDVVEMNKRS